MKRRWKKTWQGRQNKIDEWFCVDECSHLGIEDCELITDYKFIDHCGDMDFIISYTWKETNERATMRLRQSKQGSPYYNIMWVKQES